MKIQRIMMTICALLMVSAAAHGWDLPDDVELTEIRYDHIENDADEDGVTLKSDATTEVEPPEWTPSATKPVCFVAGNTVDIKAQVRRDNEYITQMSIYADHISEPGCIGDFGPTNFTYGDPNASNYDTKEMTCSWGSVPAGVGEKINYLYWYVDEINNQAVATTLIATTANSYYAVLDEPVTPFDKPFVCALESACNWASGATSAGTVVSSITSGAYDNSFVDYDDGAQYFDYPTFQLLNMYDNGLGDCGTIAAMVQTLSKGLGVSGVNLKHIDGTFHYRSIDPIGAPADTLGSYSYHFVAEYNNGIYDACLQFYPSGYQPLGMTMQAYHDSLYVSGDWDVSDYNAPLAIW